jgi:hypothetical protein
LIVLFIDELTECLTELDGRLLTAELIVLTTDAELFTGLELSKLLIDELTVLLTDELTERLTVDGLDAVLTTEAELLTDELTERLTVEGLDAVLTEVELTTDDELATELKLTTELG